MMNSSDMSNSMCLIIGIDEVAPNQTQILDPAKLFRFLSSGILGSVFVIFGLVGNSFLLLTYFLRQSQKPRPNYCIIALLLWDIALLVTSWFMLSLTSIIFRGEFPFRGPWVRVILWLYYLINVTMTGNVWITVLITVERYIAIAYPLKHRTLCTGSRIKRIIQLVSSLALVFALPRFFENQIIYCEEDVILVHSDLLFDPRYFTLYRIVCNCVMVTIVPLLLLLAMTTRISHILRVAARERNNLTAQFTQLREVRTPPTINLGLKPTFNNAVTSQKPEIMKPMRKPTRKHDVVLTKMLILIVVKFLMCYTLPTLTDILEKILEQEFQQAAFLYLVEISNILVMFHASTNFVIYLLCSPNLIHETLRMLKLKKAPKVEYTTTTTTSLFRMNSSEYHSSSEWNTSRRYYSRENSQTPSCRSPSLVAEALQ